MVERRIVTVIKDVTLGSDLQDANELGLAITEKLTSQNLDVPLNITLGVPKYNSRSGSGDDFNRRRAQLISDIVAHRPQLVIFLMPAKDKLAEQVCSILSHSENLECAFVYVYGLAEPNIGINRAKGCVIPKIAANDLATAILDYLHCLRLPADASVH